MALMDILQNNWQAITGFAGVTLTALSTLGIASRPRARGREKLKMDLEIYKLMQDSRETWPYQQALKHQINAISSELYVQDDGFRHAYHTTVGFALMAGFGWWSYELLRTDAEELEFAFSWWVLLTGYWSLVGLFMVLAALNPSLRRKLWFVRTRPDDPAAKTAQGA